MDVQLKAQCLQTVNIKARSSVDGWGTRVDGSAVPLAARVEFKVTLVMGADGEQKTTSHHIVTESEILLTDRLWLDGDSTSDATKARIPLSIGRAINEDGTVSHYETYV